MVNLRIISKIIGQLLLLEGTLMLACVAMALAWGEDDALAFLVATALTVAGGMAFKYFGRSAGNNLSLRDAYMVVAATWVVFCLFGMVPLLVGGYVPGVADAYFETMSGFSTTGATVIADVEQLPRAMLFWRSLTHWIGGLGIVFFTIAVLPSLVGGSVKVFAAEATGPVRTKMHPRLSTSAKWILTVYVALSAACAAALWASGMEWFDAVCYAMSIAATGGFANHNGSIGHYGSPTIEYVAALFQFLSGINYTMIYMATLKGRPGVLVRSSELRFYAAITLLSTCFVAVVLFAQSGYGVEKALRSALFQVTSTLTTTGMSADNASLWPPVTWLVLAFCMFTGGCAGSTSGGFKCARVAMLFKSLSNELLRLVHPNAVLPVKMDGRSVPTAHLAALLAFLAAFLCVWLLSAVLFLLAGLCGSDAMSLPLSCMSNAGQAIGGGIGFTGTWATLPSVAKWLCSMLMLLGRLEIMSVLVLFTCGFWKDN